MNGKLYRKKAIALYETKMSAKYIAMTLVLYFVAFVIWYVLAAFVPYTENVCVSDAENRIITREALSASEEQRNRTDDFKEHALLMPSSESSFHRKLRLLEDAKSSIDFAVFASYGEDWSLYFYSALLRAAERGVFVRIIVDGKLGKTGDMLDKIWKLIQNHDKMEMYYFNPINIFDPAGLMVLMHDKFMVVDNDIAVVGGVNMGRNSHLGNFDMEVMVTNSGGNGCVGQASRYFEKLINNKLTKQKTSDYNNDGLKNKYLNMYAEYYSTTEFADKEDMFYKWQGVPVDRITLITNPISSAKKSPIIWQTVCNFMSTSKKSLAVTPYALLQSDKKRAIAEYAATNDEFTIVTNSLYNTRNVAYADYYFNRKDYININIKLCEYQAENQLHAKMFSFDDRYSIIGSCNMDERSIHVDTECVLVIDSPAFNKLLNGYIEGTFIKNSLQVGIDNKYIESETVKAGTVPDGKYALYNIYKAVGIVRCVI